MSLLVNARAAIDSGDGSAHAVGHSQKECGWGVGGVVADG